MVAILGDLLCNIHHHRIADQLTQWNFINVALALCEMYRRVDVGAAVLCCRE